MGPSRYHIAGSDDGDFDKRLDALKKGKGAQRNTKRRQEKGAQKVSDSKPSAKKSKMVITVLSTKHTRLYHNMHDAQSCPVWHARKRTSKAHQSCLCTDGLETKHFAHFLVMLHTQDYSCSPPSHTQLIPRRFIAGPKYDFSEEQLHFESGPHKGDLAVNVALGATLLWLPLTAAAVGRGAFVKYRFTDKRISVITNAPWKKEQLDAAYQEVDDVQTVGRALGVWGDMVVTLKNGDKIEMRSLPKYDPSVTQALTPDWQQFV